mgnify:FL=1
MKWLGIENNILKAMNFSLESEFQATIMVGLSIPCNLSFSYCYGSRDVPL